MSMIMGDMGDEKVSPLRRSGSSTATTNSLKKQKSLTKLLSSTSRKLSRSRSRPPSPSVDDLPIPTPQVPLHLLPSLSKVPNSRGPSPTTTLESDNGAEVSQAYNGNGLDPSGEQTLAERSRPDFRTPNEQAVMDDQEPCKLQPLGIATMDESIRPHTANTILHRQFEKPTLHHSPTFPILRKRSRGEPALPVASPTGTRNRGLSTSSYKPRSSSLKAQALNRPSTSGGNYNTDTERPEAYWKTRNDGYSTIHESHPTGDDYSPSAHRPWQGLYESNEVRSSFRSALTSGSSYMDTTSTERSSVITKDTSIYDSAVEYTERPTSKFVGMTVDDAIDMYVAGFADDAESDRDNPSPSSISEEEHRRSIRIAEAVNDSIGSELLPPVRPPSSDSRSSAAIMSGAVFRSVSPKPPPISPTTPTRDQYGFLKSNHHVTIAQYDAWNAKYVLSQNRRTKKWSSFMREQGLPTYSPSYFPDKSVKAQRYVRKGIPPAWRGACWFHYAGGRALLDGNPKLYESLLSRTDGLNVNDKEAIERDLHRTFPDNVHFKPDSMSSKPVSYPPLESPLLSSLRRVLQAFALHCPLVGYCQSLNFLTGLLLLFLPEEKAFWMLHIITTDYLPGTHEISLEGANVDLWVLMVALKESMPGIWAKVGVGGEEDAGVIHGARLPPISLCTTSWFMSLFIGTLPIESVLRVWDVLFYEGSRTLFRIALAIFKLGEQKIKDVSDSMEIFQVVQALPRGMLDVGMVMKVAWRRGGVSQEWVEKKRKERRRWYARERVEKGKQSPGSGGGRKSRDDAATPALVRTNSTWRRKVRLGAGDP